MTTPRRNPKNSTSANTVARSVRISVTLDEQIAARQPASMTTGEWLRVLLRLGLDGLGRIEAAQRPQPTQSNNRLAEGWVCCGISYPLSVYRCTSCSTNRWMIRARG